MMRIVVVIAVVGALLGSFPVSAEVVRPFEESGPVVSLVNPIDELVSNALRERGIEPANLSSDEVFIRRVYLDVIGTLPQPGEVRAFLKDEKPDKRAKLVDRLLERDEFADYWTLKWCDLLRVKAEFPINLWPNGVQAYHRWIYAAVRDNMPYDQFVRELLTSSGSNFRVPPVNFYRAVQGHEPETIAGAVALTFMGTRLDTWSKSDRKNMADFFSRMAFKGTAEWKEEIVYLDPAPTKKLKIRFPDGDSVRIAAGEDPRVVFADWLITDDNPWFTRNIANRAWTWLVGRGIIHEPDDIRRDNPPSNPELLAYLEKELVDADYDLKHLFRLILNSRTYQQSSIPRSDHPDAEALFAHYAVRQLDAEVLIDALCLVFGSRESYSSPIPEPFTYVPEHQRTITLADGSITSPFLELFGRPSRDTGYESERNSNPTDPQRLHMLNSSHVQKKIMNSWRMRQLLKKAEKGGAPPVIREMYLIILSRFPTQEEMDITVAYAETGGVAPAQAAADLAWALINTKEFLCRH
ncbi:MAG: DUF1553 domain-containing protein [bacterium]|nr:DUF1553 domain-containing protein [bacterium]